ncbi:MAG: 2Fe-2S iron-sulfur cluster binding domain-containing protein, partial [Planctomycetales bacterium]|nr:2Fe-2S iron-sulfur cluster binding domain-containing protein [Planctomycetales bacterium]
MPEQFVVTINGVRRPAVSDGERPLLDVLREDLALTGTKHGCGEGECGACTVLIDGAPRRACLTSLSEAVDCKIETIEGIAEEELHVV